MHIDLPSHECELRAQAGSDRLFVSLSHKDNFAFYRQEYAGSVLFVRDKRHSYYSVYAGMLTDEIQKIVEGNGIRTVLFFGLSKGGYGSLLLSGFLARRLPDVKCIGLAFSPPTKLYPENENLIFPSYKGMIRKANTDERLRGNLEKYGDLSKFLGAPNQFWRLVYGEGNKADAAEASRFIHPSIQKYPIPFSFHGTTIPFTLRRNDPAHVDGEVMAIYRDAEKDPDLAATLPSSSSDLKKQILDARWIPSLRDMLNETLTIAG
jgi:hypothetical protein